MEMEKTFQPQNFERDLYDFWLKNGYFAPTTDKTKPYFSIVSPPPNITGQLHLGHAMDNTIMDILVRFKRMQGFNTLFLPGTDHASIATEMKIVEKLKSQGINKHEIGREEFLKHAWQWKEQYGGRIVEQLKFLGNSCDFSRLAFTMDDQRSRAVREVFKKLYDDGMIYHGNRITNYCIECKTALSDAEVEYSEQAGNLWHFSYATKDGKDKVTFATTRPETMLGDTAVAVNPNDKRYAHLVGKTVVVPFVNREIPVIADDYVDMEFGTGVVKITPAHDPNDFEVGLRHNLPVINVMNDDGTMNSEAGEFAGQNRYECRKQIVKKLTEMNVMQKIQPHNHNVGSCYRCKTTVEPIISKQWYVKMAELAKPAIEVVKNGEIEFHPKRFEKTYFNWMENIKDWCISRQLWWGHRIPVYYCDNCGNEMCSIDTPKKCDKCGNTNLRQDEDVLDTWFSSALWPFATLNYFEDDNSDYNMFFPTTVLSCGYDIIFFWVARMIFASLYVTKKIPFEHVLMHGMFRDSQGRKMSKSLGNGVDPLEYIEKYGADALRFTILNGVAGGSDIRFSDEKTENSRNFMNKIWNASRFVLMNCMDKQILPFQSIDKSKLTAADKWILHQLNETTKTVTNLVEKYELGMACQALYEFVWSTFCDWYIEFSKPVLYGTDDTQRNTNLSVLLFVLDSILKLLHPFIPFITEKIYQSLPQHNENKDNCQCKPQNDCNCSHHHDDDCNCTHQNHQNDCNCSSTHQNSSQNAENSQFTNSIMIQSYPKFTKKLVFSEQAQLVEEVKEFISKIRNIRSEYGVLPSKRIRIFIKAKNDGIKDLSLYIEKLAGIEKAQFVDNLASQQKVVGIVLPVADAEIPLGDLVDKDKEIERLTVEIQKAKEEIDRANSKLNNNGFTDKAPAKLVDIEREKLQKWQTQLTQLETRLKALD